MTDNRDIDEILASLDALLREGDSHNDDMPVEPTSSVSDTDALKALLEADVESIEASVEDILSGDAVDEKPAVEAVFDGVVAQQEDGMSRVVLTEDMMVENPQVSLPLSFNLKNVDEDSAVADASLVSDTSASDDVVEELTHSSSEDVISEHAAVEPVMRLHKQEVEQLMALVSLDVSDHLQQILPKLIKDSLHARLSDMQHESDKNNKMSDDK